MICIKDELKRGFFFDKVNDLVDVPLIQQPSFDDQTAHFRRVDKTF